MPSLDAEFSIAVFRSTKSFPPELSHALQANSRTSNIIYSHVLKAIAYEQTGASLEGHFWITCGSNDPHYKIDLILSCTEGPLGSYPIFIVSTRPLSQLHDEFLLPRVECLVEKLHALVPVERVYSVFALDPVAQVFAAMWSELTGIKIYEEPYYAAKLTYCNKKTFSPRQITSDPHWELRLAEEGDIMQAASLCYGFAREAEPFVLTQEGAIEEAEILVRNRQLWVHTIRRGDQVEIASIVAVTRESDTVSAITKVYTNPALRKRGCAERLVRRVCKHLLSFRESVVLYVAHDNLAASKVYDRVGFVGLGSRDGEGVEPWMEIGFDRNEVHLGHW